MRATKYLARLWGYARAARWLNKHKSLNCWPFSNVRYSKQRAYDYFAVHCYWAIQLVSAILTSVISKGKDDPTHPCSLVGDFTEHLTEHVHSNWERRNAYKNQFWISSGGWLHNSHIKIKVRSWKTIIEILNQNLCCGYSKEPSHWDGSFEHPKQMLKLMDKKILAIYAGKIIRIFGPVYIWEKSHYKMDRPI